MKGNEMNSDTIRVFWNYKDERKRAVPGYFDVYARTPAEAAGRLHHAMRRRGVDMSKIEIRVRNTSKR
jgi:hypothetical protein